MWQLRFGEVSEESTRNQSFGSVGGTLADRRHVEHSAVNLEERFLAEFILSFAEGLEMTIVPVSIDIAPRALLSEGLKNVGRIT